MQQGQMVQTESRLALRSPNSERLERAITWNVFASWRDGYCSWSLRALQTKFEAFPNSEVRVAALQLEASGILIRRGDRIRLSRAARRAAELMFPA